jgi:hypothetical protein
MTEHEQLADVAEVVELDDYETVNEYLRLSWVLIGTYVSGRTDYRSRQESTYYCLAWMKSKGDVRHPDGRS